jgi:hypothetical protein
MTMAYFSPKLRVKNPGYDSSHLSDTEAAERDVREEDTDSISSSEDESSSISDVTSSSESSNENKRNTLNFMELSRLLLQKQLSNLSTDKRLSPKDLQRICKNLKTSPFNKNDCCLWEGNLINQKRQEKGRYINFYFRKKKAALHRLLYLNYVGPLADDEYLKYLCPNKGYCCNINHLQKFQGQKEDSSPSRKIHKKSTVTSYSSESEVSSDFSNDEDISQERKGMRKNTAIKKKKNSDHTRSMSDPVTCKILHKSHTKSKLGSSRKKNNESSKPRFRVVHCTDQDEEDKGKRRHSLRPLLE